MEHGDQITKEYLQEIYDVICDVVCVKRKSVRIGGEDYPYQCPKLKSGCRLSSSTE